jgi:hypothetical protein
VDGEGAGGSSGEAAGRRGRRKRDGLDGKKLLGLGCYRIHIIGFYFYVNIVLKEII